MIRYSVLIFGLVVAGCMGGANSGPYGDTTTVWYLTTMNGKAMNGPSTLQFTEDGIAGQGTCNRFRAAQTAQYPAFQAGVIAATKRACLHPVADENSYFQALENVTTASKTDTTLVLNGPNGNELVFTAGS